MTKDERVNQFRRTMGYIIPASDLYDIETKLGEMGFFDKPASTKHHGTEDGDLFQHSHDVTKNLLHLTRCLSLKWERPISPYLVGMFHDLCKCYTYVKNEDGKWEYAKDLILTGHGDLSVILAQRIMALTDEEIACIRWHMGAFDEKENWNRYGAAIRKYQNVLYTHTADMIAAHVHGI